MLAEVEQDGRQGAPRVELSAEQTDLIAYWRDCFASHGGIPPRRALDPTMFARALPRVALLEEVVDAARSRLRFRLVGEVVIQAMGRNPTGAWLDEALRPDCLGMAQAHFDQARRGDSPRVDTLTLPDPLDPLTTFSYTGVTLPFDADPVTGRPRLFLHAIDPGLVDLWAWRRAGSC